MSRQKVQPPPSREELRAADNVRPHDGLDPARCTMLQERPAFDKDGNCLVCAYRRWGSTTHCHLLETCDRCHSETEPCDTAQQLHAGR